MSMILATMTVNGAKVRTILVLIHTVSHLDAGKRRNSVPYSSAFDRMLHLRARTFAPFANLTQLKINWRYDMLTPKAEMAFLCEIDIPKSNLNRV